MIEKIFVFVIGAVVGSFLNVCIHRMPRKASIVTPRSHCPKCKRPILWYDNIPLLSYVLLGGRCRSCRSRIGPRYFIVEFITASLFLGLFSAFGFNARFFAYTALVSALIVSTFIDFEIQEIPDEITIPGIIIGLAAAPFFNGFLNSLSGALIGGLTIYAMGFLGEIVFKREAMGGGDVKLLAMIGAFIGWKLVLLTFFIAPLFGSIAGVIAKLRKGEDIIPYGPYLSMGAVVSIFWGEKILNILFAGM